MKLSVKNMVYIALLAAITIVATFINLTIPVGGAGGALVHFGTAVAAISILVFGKRTGTIASTLGMSLFDLFGGWAVWLPGTFLARLMFGWILGFFAYNKDGRLRSKRYQALGIILGGVVMSFIYYIWEVFLYHQPIVALGSIPANVLQFVFALVIAIPVSIVLNSNNQIKKY